MGGFGQLLNNFYAKAASWLLNQPPQGDAEYSQYRLGQPGQASTASNAGLKGHCGSTTAPNPPSLPELPPPLFTCSS